MVLLPYEFTLLSNRVSDERQDEYVLLPYEFTLLSNQNLSQIQINPVLLPYEFTLLSNTEIEPGASQTFYYLMNLHYSQTG